MKFFRKINKGLILTIIVLIVLTAYLVGLESFRNSQKENIKKACVDYIELKNSYAMLPEEYRTVNKDISTDELNKYIDTIKKDLSTHVISNDNVLNLETNSIKSSLQSQIDSKNIITSYDKKIVDINSYSFEGDQVTVVLNNFYEKEVETILEKTFDEATKSYINKTDKSKTSANTQDTIILKNESNEWKVVYSNIIDLQMIVKY